jgi:hypothetical protein
MVVLLALMMDVARLGVADLYAERPAGALDERPLVAGSFLDSALAHTETAHQWDPYNPAHLENLARLHAAQAESLRAGAPQQALLQQALMEAREALVLRPAWPYTWATLLRIKKDRREADAEFLAALHQAARLGPWEGEVQLQLADAGLFFWAQLPQESQNLVLQDVVRGRRTEPQQMMAIVLQARP